MSELKVNTISEVTGANGVVVDSVKLKDGGVIIADAGNIGSASDTDALAISSGGVVTFTQKPVINSGVTIDNITIDGTEIDLSSGDLTLDVAGDIILDADGGDVKINDGGTAIAELTNSSTDFVIKSVTNDKDIIFKGVDNSSAITALTLDMSAAGAATFNNAITSGAVITSGAGLVIADTGNIGSASDTDAIAIAADGDVTFSQKVGVISAHDLGTGIHIKTADSGAAVEANADELVVEGSGNTGITILSGTSSVGAIHFNDSGGNERGAIKYNHNADEFQIKTGGTQHLNIDSAGHVTTPLNPAFRLVQSSSGDYANGHTAFTSNTTEQYDVNGDLASNGTFTAPVTGKYLFTIGIADANSTDDTSYDMRLITSNRDYRWGIRNKFEDNTTGITTMTVKGSVLVDMDANDTASVQVATSVTITIEGNVEHSFFSGVLIG